MIFQAIDRREPSAIPSLFAYGFRPFFLLSGLSAVCFLGTWLSILQGGGWPSEQLSPTSWHGHEMLFGFVGATIAGFLLTAIPGWTGSRPIRRWPLVALTALWIAGRAASSPYLAPSIVGAVIDLAFFPALGAAVALPLIRAGKARNAAFLVLLSLLFTANLLFHMEWLGISEATSGRGIALAVGTVLMMITVIGGRIVPAFTRNTLRVRFPDMEIALPPWLERLVLAATFLMIPVDLLWPDSRIAGGVALAAALAHAARLFHWRGARTLDRPILWSLHLAYGWIIVGLTLKALYMLGGVWGASAWLHALTVGAFSTMILAVMTRAALGHTGRPLVAATPTVAAYILLTLAGLARIAVPVLPGSLFHMAIGAAGLSWIGAFLLFIWVYAPILTRPRADGQPG